MTRQQRSLPFPQEASPASVVLHPMHPITGKENSPYLVRPRERLLAWVRWKRSSCWPVSAKAWNGGYYKWTCEICAFTRSAWRASNRAISALDQEPSLHPNRHSRGNGRTIGGHAIMTHWSAASRSVPTHRHGCGRFHLTPIYKVAIPNVSGINFAWDIPACSIFSTNCS